MRQTRIGRWDALEQIKGKLIQIASAKTVRIGLEPDISPDDYPIIRIVPTRYTGTSRTATNREMSVRIYFGLDVSQSESKDESSGHEYLHKMLTEMEDKIVRALNFGDGCKFDHVETVTDEDRLTAYKLYASIFKVTY